MGKHLSFLCFFTTFIAALLCVPASSAFADNSAVFLLYQNVGLTDKNGLSIEDFDAHLSEMTGGGYHLAAPKEVLSAFKKKTSLPEKTILLTLEGENINIRTDIWPRLKQKGIGLMLFVATGAIESTATDTLSWDDLRALKKDGVMLGLRGHWPRNLVARSADDVRADLQKAKALAEKNLGVIPDLFAWPFGYASTNMMDLLRQEGFAFAFGQHSGAAWVEDNPYFLPRYSFSKGYGDMGRLKLALGSLPFPAQDIMPVNPVISQNPPLYGFTLAEPLAMPETMACYASHEGKLSVSHLGPRIEIRMNTPLPRGKAGRVNCTARTPEGRWMWRGRLFLTQ